MRPGHLETPKARRAGVTEGGVTSAYHTFIYQFDTFYNSISYQYTFDAYFSIGLSDEKFRILFEIRADTKTIR